MREKLLILISAMILLYIFVSAKVRGEEITPDTVVLCYFGSGEGQIGIEKSDMQHGPEYFGIDENGNVYVGDSYNNRIVKFNSEGKVVRYFRREGPISGIIAFRGRVYFGFGDRIVIYDTLGNLVEELKGVWHPRVDRYGYLHVYFKKGEIVFDENFDTVAVAYTPFPSMDMWWSGNRVYYLSPHENNRLVIMEIELGKGGNALERIKNERVVKCDPYLEKLSGAFIEGEDMYGNIYISATVWEGFRVEGGIRRPKGYWKFIKLSPDGEYLGEIRVRFKDRVLRGDLGHARRVSPRGDIYLANMDEEKHWIVRYPTEMFKKP